MAPDRVVAGEGYSMLTVLMLGCGDGSEGEFETYSEWSEVECKKVGGSPGLWEFPLSPPRPNQAWLHVEVAPTEPYDEGW
jgi:hypothetical protein